MKKESIEENLEKRLLTLQKKIQKQSITIEDILHPLSGKGQPFIVILLSLPFCQPIQIPGLSTPFGLIIAFIGLRMAFGHRVWLPQKVLKKTISPDTLKTIIDKTLVLTKKMKRWVYPRMEWICHSPTMKIVNGLTISLLGLILALPLPIPLSNIIAAWALFFMSLGILEDDGLFVTLGYAILALIIALFLLLILEIKVLF